MNVLCHLALAGDQAERQAGQFLGDFCKGPVDQFSFSGEVKAGLRDHRRIDARGDAHAFTRMAKNLLPPPSRRYGGIVLDLYCDWLLHEMWDEVMPEPKRNTLKRYNTFLAGPHPDWPPPANAFARILVEHDILQAYGYLSEIRYTLSRLSQRLRKPVNFSPLLDRVIREERWFRSHFVEFFGDMKQAVSDGPAA